MQRREVGQTPPSATQPSKLLVHRTNQTVATNEKSLTSVPPAITQAQLIGSDSLSDASNGQPTVSVPPVNNNPQLSGSDSTLNAAQPPVNNMNSQSNGIVSSQTESVPPVSNDHNGSNSTSVDQPVSNAASSDNTYASVASSLCAAIVDQRSPGSINLMDQKRFDLLSSLITDKIIGQAGKNIKLPTIDDTRLFSGVMRVRCANLNTRQWLDKYIPLLDKKKLWNGVKLTVMDFGNIPKPHKFNVWCRGVKKSPQDIFKLLEALNKGISTKSWSVLRYETKGDGTQMTIGVGQDSFDALQKRANSLYCGLGKAEFKVVQNFKENRDAIKPGDKRRQISKQAIAKKAATNAFKDSPVQRDNVKQTEDDMEVDQTAEKEEMQ